MPKRLLLADDSLTIHRVVELTFADEDFEIISARSGTEAIEKINQERPDIVIADVNMPEQDGYQVCKYIKSNPELAHIPVILLKGIFEPYDEEKAREAGYDAVISKPFQSKSFIAKVKETLASAKRERGEPVEVSAPSVPEVGGEPPRQEAPPQPVGGEMAPPASAPPEEKLTPEKAIEEERKTPTVPPKEEMAPPKAKEEPISPPLKVEQPASPPPSTEETVPVEPSPKVEGFVPPSAPSSEGEIFSGIEGLSEDEILELERQLEAQESMLEQLSEGGDKEVPSGRVSSPPPEVPSSPKEKVAPSPPPVKEETPPREPSPPQPAAGVEAPKVEERVEAPPEASVPPKVAEEAKEGVISLTDEAIEQIVERVVAKLSDKAVREIAWEVIPELAERLIKQAIEEIKKS